MKRDPERFAHFNFFIPRELHTTMREIKNRLSEMAGKTVSFPTLMEFAIDALKREIALDPVCTARPVIDESAKVLKVWTENGKSYYQAYNITGKAPNRKLKKVVGSGVFGYKVKGGKYRI